MEMYRKSALLSTLKGYYGQMKNHRNPFVKLAWTVIILLVSGIAYLQTLSTQEESQSTDDAAEMVIVRIQAEYLLGVGALVGNTEEIALSAGILDAGSVGQRQRYMAFMIALGNQKGAVEADLHLHADLLETGQELTAQQSMIQEALNILATGSELPIDKIDAISQLGWFGTLLTADETSRAVITASSEEKIMIVGSAFVFICALCIIGFGGLIVCFISALTGNIGSSMLPSSKSHGIYAEVFAIWLLAFLLLSAGAGALAHVLAKDNMLVGMLCTLGAFFASLLVLTWARIRGISWEQLRNDIGWTSGTGLNKEFLTGLFGYAMTLPILGAGILITMVLMLVQQEVVGSNDPFSGDGGGAHPIIVEIANGGWGVRILLVILAAVAAPIVEETMFRGVLYRQLRTSSHRIGLVLSITISVLLTSFLFAAIHPQGWVAIPALMGIAIGMNLLREWRGSLIPSMMVHGISNGIVVSMMLVFLS